MVEPTKADKKREDQFRAEMDFRDLERADEIRADRKRLAGVRRYATRLQKTARKLTKGR